MVFFVSDSALLRCALGIEPSLGNWWAWLVGAGPFGVSHVVSFLCASCKATEICAYYTAGTGARIGEHCSRECDLLYRRFLRCFSRMLQVADGAAESDAASTRKRKRPERSFFDWFGSSEVLDDDYQSSDVVLQLLVDIWSDPMKFYYQPEVCAHCPSPPFC